MVKTQCKSQREPFQFIFPFFQFSSIASHFFLSIQVTVLQFLILYPSLTFKRYVLWFSSLVMIFYFLFFLRFINNIIFFVFLYCTYIKSKNKHTIKVSIFSFLKSIVFFLYNLVLILLFLLQQWFIVLLNFNGLLLNFP